MLQKGCEYREREIEKWKQNWDEVFMDEVQKIESVNVLKCSETEKDKRFTTLPQLSFYVLKVQSK
jgi:hypothetical protein